MRKLTVPFLALVVALAAGASCASASASSIFFIRASNIWVANADGSGAKPVTTDGSYDFVSSAKQGSAPPLAFHRGGTANQFGTINPDGSGETVNPYNASMQSDGRSFTRLDDAGDRVTWPQKCSCSGLNFFAAAVATNGSAPQEIYNLGTMDAQEVTFGDPTGASLLFTDTGDNYRFGGNPPCSGSDDFADVLVLQTPPPPGSNSGPAATAVYCENSTILRGPALRPDGQLIAAESQSASVGSSGAIVTIPVGGGVTTSTGQSPLIQITPPNSGDSLPDFSPDGTEIAFQGPGETIDTVPAAGGAPKQILTDATVPAWSPYSLPAGGGGEVSDQISAVKLAKRTVRFGKPVLFEVTLKAPATITIRLSRAASGPGRRPRKATYKLLGTLTFQGKSGLNKLPVSKLHGRKLPVGRYQAQLAATGGAEHTVSFAIKR
jgi:hypothetical protein